MKLLRHSAISVFFLLMTSGCSASNTVGFQCELRDNKGKTSLHLSADFDKGLFTGRVGATAMIVKKPAAVDIGSASDPANSQFRFKIDANPGQTFIIVRPGGDAIISSWSGATSNGSGHCTLDTFKGL